MRPGAPYGEFDIWLRADVAIVTTPAEVAAHNAHQFWEALAVTCTRHKMVIVDLTATDSCDVNLVTALLMALRYTGDGRSAIRIAASPSVRALIQTSSLRHSLPLFDSIADALRAVPRPRPSPDE